MPIEGFWSYVHDDDDAEGGRIRQLARDVVAQYELLTGESIRLFLDRDDLEWGDQWHAKIDQSLASVAFFIPVLTPRYFQSAECRRELNTFIRKSQQLGLTELLMPILYVDFPAVHTEPPGDELIGLVRPFQWEDWTELRYSDVTSAEYRRSVANMAQRLVNANAAAETRSAAARAQPSPGTPEAGEDNDEEDDDAPGSLELFQQAIEGLASWSETLQEMTQHIGDVGQILSVRGAEVDNAPTNPKNEIAVRLRILKATAQDLQAPVSELDRLSEEYTRNLYDVDPGVRLAIDLAPAEVDEGKMTLQDACEFYAAIRGFAASAEEALANTQGMLDSMAPIERLSRDIRPVLRNLRKALTRLVEGGVVISAWVAQMNGKDLDCGAA